MNPEEFNRQFDKSKKILNKTKPSNIVNFGEGNKARIIRTGKEILTLKLIGKKKLKSDAIGDIVSLFNRKFTIISCGKTIMLRLIQEV